MVSVSTHAHAAAHSAAAAARHTAATEPLSHHGHHALALETAAALHHHHATLHHRGRRLGPELIENLPLEVEGRAWIFALRNGLTCVRLEDIERDRET